MIAIYLVTDLRGDIRACHNFQAVGESVCPEILHFL